MQHVLGREKTHRAPRALRGETVLLGLPGDRRGRPGGYCLPPLLRRPTRASSPERTARGAQGSRARPARDLSSGAPRVTQSPRTGAPPREPFPASPSRTSLLHVPSLGPLSGALPGILSLGPFPGILSRRSLSGAPRASLAGVVPGSPSRAPSRRREPPRAATWISWMRLKPSFPKNSTRLASVRGPGMAARLRGPSARPPACDTPGRPAPLSSARALAGSPEPAGRGCPASQPPQSPLRPAAGLGRAFRIRSSRAIAIPCVGRFEQFFCFEGCFFGLRFNLFERRSFEVLRPGHQFTQTFIERSLP